MHKLGAEECKFWEEEEEEEEGLETRACNMEVQDLKDKPCRNEDQRSLEAGPPRLRENMIGEGSEESQGWHGCGM